METNSRGDAVEFWMTDVVLAPAEYVAQIKIAPTWPELDDVAVLGDHMASNALPTDRWTAAAAITLVMDGGASPAWIRN